MTETKPRSKKMLWTGWIISVICILFLLVDALMKVVKASPSIEGSTQLGWPASLVQITGIILLLFTVIYSIPRTAIWGALLLTAYLGGATAIMLRAGQPFFFPVVFGILVWAGIYFRSEKMKLILSS